MKLEQFPESMVNKPWLKENLIKEFSAEEVECYQAPSFIPWDEPDKEPLNFPYQFVPKDKDNPNELAKCLEYAFRRGRVFLINEECTGFTVDLQYIDNGEWPYATLNLRNNVLDIWIKDENTDK